MHKLSLFTSLLYRMKFPHYSRIITADRTGNLVYLTVLVSLLTIILLNIFSVDISDTEERLRGQILKTPFTSKLHEELGSLYLKSNRVEAQREFQLAQELYKPVSSSTPSVLGATSQPIDMWNSMVTIREKLLAEKERWESVAKVYPDYTYAYVKIAEIEMDLGNEEASKRLIEKVRETSPLNMEVKILGKGE